MKKVILSIGERIAAIKIFDGFKGSLATLAVLLEDVKPVAVSEEDWKKAELKKTPTADGKSEQWNWKEEGQEKEVTLQKESVDYLLAEIKRKSDTGEVTLADIALISLEKKLK